MNMPVLPAIHASQPAADTPARTTNADPSQDTPAFSNVLSSQRGATAGDKTPAAAPKGRADASDLQASKKDTPLGPDETLALILDSTALPLMQPQIQTPAVLRQQAGVAGAGHDAPADAATSRRGPAAAALLVPGTSDTPDTPAGRSATPDAAPRSARTAQLPITQATPAQTRFQAAEPAATASRTATTSRVGALPAATLDGKTPLATALAAATGNTAAPTTTAHPTPAPDILASASAAPLGATSLPATASPTAQAPIQASVPTPLSNPQWPQDFSRQVLNLVQAGTGAAGHTVTMHVNPPELGPIHITLHLGDSLAQASFVSPHANVRQALENALPHLEQQLAQAGLSLGQANVSDQQAGQQQSGQAPQGSGSSGGAVFSLDGDMAANSTHADPTVSPQSAPRPDALVDTFA